MFAVAIAFASLPLAAILVSFVAGFAVYSLVRLIRE
jgi:hypothetical protein